MEWRVPLADIDFGPEEEQAVQAVLHSRWLSMGEVTRAFEGEFAEFVGAKHAIAVTNATAALHLACVAVGLKPGDEVILPSLTFVATANAVRYTGAAPVFADIESLDQLTISPTAIERRHYRADQGDPGDALRRLCLRHASDPRNCTAAQPFSDRRFCPCYWVRAGGTPAGNLGQDWMLQFLL